MSDPAPPSTMRRDLLTAYVATACRIGSWVVVSALVFRYFQPRYFALLTLVRATVGVLNYTAVGLTPALIHFLSRASTVRPTEIAPPAVDSRRPAPAGDVPDDSAPVGERTDAPAVPPPSDADVIFSSGISLARWTCLAAVVLTFAYALTFARLHAIDWGSGGQRKLETESLWLVVLMGLGVVLRLGSEPAAAALQLRGKIATDNLIVAAGEIVWVVLSALWLSPGRQTTVPVGASFLIASGVVFAARWRLSSEARTDLVSQSDYVRLSAVRMLLKFGALVMLAQVADFLYAPTDYVLINRLIDPVAVAAYAPAVQVDGGLLLLVAGLASVLLPKAALAHAGGRPDALRRYYVLGTVASIAMLAVASLSLWALAPALLRAWLKNPMPETQAILPLVLVHTVVGGSSAIGRSILLGMGKVRAFTAAVLIAGVSNVVLSYCFVRYLHLGLNGIIYGTIVVVVARCAVWMPWYVLKTLREQGGNKSDDAIEQLPTAPAPEL